MVKTHCTACFAPLTETVEARLRGKLDQPWRCDRCGAVLMLTNNLDGVERVVRVVLGVGPEDEIVLDARLNVRPGVFLVCAWNPEAVINASALSRIMGGVNLSYPLRLLKQGVFPGAERAEGEREWRIPMRDVHAYLLRRATGSKRAAKDQQENQQEKEEKEQ